MESGRSKLGVNSFERAGKYLLDIGKLGMDRWPIVCLREELRGLENGNPSKWGKMLKQAFERVGDGESLGKILVEGGRRENVRK